VKKFYWECGRTGLFKRLPEFGCQGSEAELLCDVYDDGAPLDVVQTADITAIKGIKVEEML